MVIKKKKLNKKVFIAIGAAFFIAIILFVMMNSSKTEMLKLSSAYENTKNEIEKLQKEAEEAERKRKLEKRNEKFSPNPKITNETKKTKENVVILKNNVIAGKKIKLEDLDIKEVPIKSRPLNSFNVKELLVGRITGTDLLKGEAVLESKLISKDTKMLNIKSGFRAMTIPVNNITGVAGLITKGSRVDILTVIPKNLDAKSGSNEKISRILMQNIKVLSTSQDIPNATIKSRKVTNSKTIVPTDTTITLAVPTEEVAKLALAFDNGAGNIQVILRGYEDEEMIANTSIDTSELITGTLSNQSEFIPDIDLPSPSSSNYSEGSTMDLNSILSDNSDNLPLPEIPQVQTKIHTIEVIQANSREEIPFETEI